MKAGESTSTDPATPPSEPLPVMSKPDNVQSEVWRVRLAGRVAAVVLTIGWIALAVVISAGSNAGVSVVMWLAAVLIGVGAWRWAFMPYLASSPDGVVIQNRFTRATVPWSEIARVRPGYYGLIIHKKTGGSVTAWAVQKSNVARWTGKSSRGNEVAEVLMAWAISSS